MDLLPAHRLTAPFQLCLAHYCDLHGPTPMMVTEGLPVPCTTCFDHDPDADPDAAPPAPSVAAITDALRSIDFTPHRTSSLPTAQPARPPPPLRSPTSPAGSPAKPPPRAPRRDGSFRKTYDENVTKRAHPCDNCAMTLPPSSSPDPSRERGPTLRTRAPHAWVFGGPGESPPASQPSSGSDTSGDGDDGPKPRGAAPAPSPSSDGSSRSGGSTPGSHTHFVEYISTKEPLLAASFSLVRASCLRTLSFEMLPRAQTSPPPQQPTALPSTGAPASSGGPIFFGDPGAGYTTAYIFRVPDPYARGHRRIYAFLALSTHGERTAMKTFNVASAAFRDLAGWITAMAEAEAEGGGESPRGAVEGSFLTGGGGAFVRRGPGGVGGGLGKVRQRGLAEVVGCPDFFIQLHIRFVKILRELGVKMNG